GPSLLAIMHEIATVDPPAPSTINVKLPAAFNRVLQRAIAKNRDDRYGSVQELAEDLGALDQQKDSGVKLARRWSGSTLQWRWALVVLAAILAMVTGGVLRPTLRSPHAPMVAVLPFEDLSSTAVEPYISQGVTEEVIAQLGRTGASRFGVIGGTSIWRYRQSHPSPRQLGADLGVGHLLTGTIRREGSVIRMTARLIRTRDEVQVWADSFEHSSGNVLMLQQEVAVEAARAVATELSRPVLNEVQPR